MLIADRLVHARLTRFVGRLAELQQFEQMLSGTSPFIALLIHGPGGVGKTTLLQEFASRAQQHGRAVVRLDARHIEPQPAAFLTALRAASGLGEGLIADGSVLLLDTCEHLAAIEIWLRDELLPRLPAGCLLVMAGRQRPDAGWHSDVGWGSLAARVSLRDLAASDARELLTRRSVAAADHDAVLRVGRGHPLALSLLADALREGRHDVLAESAEHRLDLISELAQRMASRFPTSDHRGAFQTLILAPTTTVELLRLTVGEAMAPALHEWLRTLSGVEASPQGLLPHDLMRDAFEVVFEREDPTGWHSLQARIRSEINRRVQAGRERDQYRFAREWVFMWRKHDAIRNILDWRRGQHYADSLRENDRPRILALSASAGGPDTTRIVEHWLRRQPDAVHVVRGVGGEPDGFFLMLDFRRITAEDVAADPGVASVDRHLRSRGRHDATSAVAFTRLAMHTGFGEEASPTLDLVSVANITRWLCDRALNWTFVASSARSMMTQLMTGADLFHRHEQVYEAEFVVDGRSYAVFARDWHAQPHPVWLSQDGSPGPTPRTLDRGQFSNWVTTALRCYTRTEVLQQSPLRDVLAADLPAGSLSAEELRIRLATAAEELSKRPRDLKFHRAITAGCLRPEATQEASAEALGLPLNTYRYQVQRGIAMVSEILWQTLKSGDSQRP